MLTSVWVINLAASVDRAASIQQNLGSLGIPFRFFPAVNGEALTFEEIAVLGARPYAGNYGRALSKRELGCAASHLAVLRMIANGHEDFVCVLEDDARPQATFLRFLDRSALEQLPPFDVLRLLTDWRYAKRAALRMSQIGETQIFAPLWPGNSAAAQIYTRDGARKILRRVPPLHGPIDTTIFDDVRVPGLRVIETRPSVVRLAELASTIGSNDQGLRGARMSKTISSVIRRNLFRAARRIRGLYSFTRAWGLTATLELYRSRNAR